MRQSALFAALVALMSVEARDRTFTIVNQCTQPIWTGIFNTKDHPPMVFADNKQKTTGFKLEANGGKKLLTAPDQWGGRIWPRTKCKQEGGQFVCQSGNCPGTDENCKETGEVCTLAEFSIFPENGDWYNLSLVDGFNVPVQIKPSKMTAKCPNLTCSTDLLKTCPKELLAFGGSVCSSACKKGLALGKYQFTDAEGKSQVVDGDRNCCLGPYNLPGTCPAEGVDYYHVFKEACPDAYAHAYDDNKSLQVCPKDVQPDYTITFCPAPAPSYLEQQAAFGVGPGGQEKPAVQPQGRSNQQVKRAAPISLLASKVCIPAGYTLVEGGGDVKPQGECVPVAENAGANAGANNNPPVSPPAPAAPPATASAPNGSVQASQPSETAPPTPPAPGGQDQAGEIPPSPPAPGTPDESKQDGGKAPDSSQSGITAASNSPGQASTSVTSAESSTALTSNTPPTQTANAGAGPTDVPAAPTDVPPLGQDKPNLTGPGGPPAGGETPPQAPPNPPHHEGSEYRPEDKHAKPKKPSCMGKRKHAGMKRMEEDARM